MATSKRGRPPLKVLFIGNSFTARNDLPGLIAQLAAARGRSMEYRLINVGGASLRTHWNAGEAQKAIRDGHYDRVVLQEQSTLPVKNARRMHENVRLFDGAIRAAGAQTILYMTWARQNAPESQQTVTDAYAGIGRELGATVVPVGQAWERFLRQHDRPVLHDKDQSHPTPAGSYLAACVFLAVLFEESPVGIGGQLAGLSEEDLVLLQKVAWQECEPGRPARASGGARTSQGKPTPFQGTSAARRFSGPTVEELARAKILGVRSGTEHRYTGVWVVVVEGRVFVRSWNDRPTGWYRAFQTQPLGSIQLAGRDIAVRARQLRGERLRDAVTRAYARKYDTKASEKWVRGFAEPGRAAATLELLSLRSSPTLEASR
jgi:hypothetical protein